MPSLKIITRGKIALALISLAALAIASCSGNPGSEIRLQGAGATFPNPLYQKWLSEYGKLHSNVRIDYQSIGSGGGIKQIQAQTVDFGAWVGPLSKAAWKAAQDNSFIIRMVWGPLALPITLR